MRGRRWEKEGQRRAKEGEKERNAPEQPCQDGVEFAGAGVTTSLSQEGAGKGEWKGPRTRAY